MSATTVNVAHHVLRRRRHGDETEAERCYSIARFIVNSADGVF